MLNTKPNIQPETRVFDMPGDFDLQTRMTLLQVFATAGDYDIGRISTTVMPSGINPHFQIRLADGTREFTKSITGVVIHVQPTRVFWGRPYEENNGEPPQCSSDNGMVGIGNPGGDCFQCPHLRNFACTETHYLYVIPEGEYHPITLRVTPGSLNNWQRYIATLRQSMMDWNRSLDDIRDPITAVITHFELEEKSPKPRVEHMCIKPSVEALLNPEDQAMFQEIRRTLSPLLGKTAYTPNMISAAQIIQSERAIDTVPENLRHAPQTDDASPDTVVSVSQPENRL